MCELGLRLSSVVEVEASMAIMQQLAFAGVARTPGGFFLSRSRSDVGKVKLPPVQVFDLQRLPSIEREEMIEYFSPSPSPRPPSGRRRVRAQAVETEKAAKVADEFSLKDLEVKLLLHMHPPFHVFLSHVCVR